MNELFELVGIKLVPNIMHVKILLYFYGRTLRSA